MGNDILNGEYVNEGLAMILSAIIAVWGVFCTIKNNKRLQNEKAYIELITSDRLGKMKDFKCRFTKILELCNSKKTLMQKKKLLSTINYVEFGFDPTDPISEIISESFDNIKKNPSLAGVDRKKFLEKLNKQFHILLMVEWERVKKETEKSKLLEDDEMVDIYKKAISKVLGEKIKQEIEEEKLKSYKEIYVFLRNYFNRQCKEEITYIVKVKKE